MLRSRSLKVTAVFFGSLAGLAALVFAYTYLSGGGGLGKHYMAFYYPIAAIVLTVGASAASRRKGS
ncbi:MAG TPA: hypothetical protein PKK63_00325 [Bacillota bacterium]|nr:hypothetical protein [Bacillota bacterium]HPU95414.1 hypothetical protein [Bacillota bacterium]